MSLHMQNWPTRYLEIHCSTSTRAFYVTMCGTSTLSKSVDEFDPERGPAVPSSAPG